jgi:hypothetical protein
MYLRLIYFVSNRSYDYIYRVSLSNNKRRKMLTILFAGMCFSTQFLLIFYKKKGLGDTINEWGRRDRDYIFNYDDVRALPDKYQRREHPKRYLDTVNFYGRQVIPISIRF